ncbi:MAG: AraC family transcriptional regulator [Clostridiales bacterium]|nr:AraC family transcriptional regulator [Clostridiales bacterium]
MSETAVGFVKNNLYSPVNVTGIYTIHYFKYGRNFKFKGERHDFWEMVYIDSGNAKVIADDKEFSLKQGEAFFHKPNELHTIYTDDDFANSAIISFECKSRSIKQIAGKIFSFDDYEKSLLNKIVHEAKISYVDKLNDVYLTKMTKRTSAPFGGEQIIKNNTELLIVSLLRKEESQYKFAEELSLNLSSNKIVENVQKILFDKLDNAENINLDEISYKLGFSKSYIKSQFKKQTGSSVIQYYIDLKIDRAKKLLSQQKFTVSEIADSLGFSSVYYFSRQFKLYTDMSPTEYANSIKADNVL